MNNLWKVRKQKSPWRKSGAFKNTGNVLLSHTGLPCSTIGAIELNFRVRNGIGCILYAIVTGKIVWVYIRTEMSTGIIKIDQVSRLISITRLSTLLHLHLWPIKPVFYWKSSVPPKRKGKSYLGMGFALICFQRLSLPNVATLQCRWCDNRYTRGSSTSVLSY